MSQSILLVGAGAVGQVYAHHFARAGHDVNFFLKEKHVAEARQGFTLYDLNRDRHRRHPLSLEGFGCYSDWREVGRKTWDQVWLCVSSAALASMDLEPMAGVIGGATVVVLQPGPEDLARVRQVVPAEQVVAGMITLMSYHAPLSGEQVPRPGTAFWIPPLTPMPVDGRPERAEAVAAVLRESGIRAARRPGFTERSVHSTGLFMVFLAALELAGWDFRTLAGDRTLLATLKAARREVAAVLEQRYGVSAPWWSGMTPGGMIAGGLRCARHVTPVDLQVFFEAHFSKVRSQTVALLAHYAALAESQGAAHTALDALREDLAAISVPPSAQTAC